MTKTNALDVESMTDQEVVAAIRGLIQRSFIGDVADEPHVSDTAEGELSTPKRQPHRYLRVFDQLVAAAEMRAGR